MSTIIVACPIYSVSLKYLLAISSPTVTIFIGNHLRIQLTFIPDGSIPLGQVLIEPVNDFGYAITRTSFPE